MQAQVNSYMPWIIFLLSSAVVVLAAIQLTKFGDAIAIRTGLGGMFIGLILMATATSLPELLTTINAFRLGIPDLAAGNLFGSNMFNMLLIGLIDIFFFRMRVLRFVANRHTLSGNMSAFMVGLAVLLVIADIDIRIGWLGLDALLLMAAYIGALFIIRQSTDSPAESAAVVIDGGVPSLRYAIIGFSLATLVLILAMPYLVSSSNDIAEITGLTTGFIGVALVAFVTSLPEMVATIAAVRIGAYDLAIGNLFGSNMFNMFALGFSDLFLTTDRFIAVIAPEFLLVGMISLILTLVAVIGNQSNFKRKLGFIEIDALLLIVIYFLGIFLIYQRGISI
jgi:cation:H+ antiporter